MSLPWVHSSLSWFCHVAAQIIQERPQSRSIAFPEAEKISIGVAYSTHIAHVRNIKKKISIIKRPNIKYFFCFTIGATLKEKNLLPLRVAPILEAILGTVFKIFPGCA